MIKKLLSPQSKKVAADLSYTIGASLILQIALQLIIFPWINRTAGEEALGEVVYYMGILFIVSMSAGLALCNARLVDRNKYPLANGDIFPMLMIFSGMSAVFCGGFAIAKGENLGFALSFALLSVLMVVRYYVQVEYRLSKNFKGQLLFNIIISAGFLLGLVLFGKFASRFLIFAVGELAVIMFILKKGTVLTPQKSTGHFSLFAKTSSFLIFSCLIDNLISQWDRIILAEMIDKIATAQFFAFSTAGKSLQMLVGPINILLISYFTANKKENINRRAFRKILLVLLGLSGAIYILSVIFTPVFISVFYPGMYGSLSFGLNIIVNLFHILNLSSSVIIVLVLTERGAKTQMTIQMIYGLVFITASAVGTYFYQMAGFAIAGIAAGALRFILIAAICLRYLPGEGKKG